MEFRINYWDILKSILGFNLLIILGIQIPNPEYNKVIPFVLLVANVFFFLGALADPSLRFIKIDKRGNRVVYALLFHSPETVEYARLRSEWTIKRTGRWRDSTRNELVFRLDGQEIFSLSENLFGWSTEQLNSIHELLSVTSQAIKKPAD